MLGVAQFTKPTDMDQTTSWGFTLSVVKAPQCSRIRGGGVRPHRTYANVGKPDATKDRKKVGIFSRLIK